MTLTPRLEEHYLPIGCPACGRTRLLCAGNYVRCEKCGAESDALSDAQEKLTPGGVSPRVAFEILKDVFLGDGKPGSAGDAIRCLANLMPRVEAYPTDWWNRPPEDHQSNKRRAR